MSPTDILGIEYECSHCHARHLIPIEKFESVLYQCPNCKEGMATATQANTSQKRDDSTLHHFVEALRDMQALTLQVRLHVSNSLRVSDNFYASRD